MGETEYCTEFGKLFKKHRKRTGLTLRAFCRKHGLDNGNISKLERGLRRPPTGKTLDKYAKCLGLTPDSDEWYELHDVAAACAGEVPERIMSDEELVKKLPVVFRTFGRSRPSKKELEDLLDTIRES